MHFQTETLNQMTVMGHHGPLLALHFAEQILTAVYLKHLQPKTLVAIYISYFHKINPKEQQQQLVDLLFLIFLTVKINPLEVLTNSFVSMVSNLKASTF